MGITEKFVEAVCDNVKYKTAHKKIKNEILSCIKEDVNKYMEEGIDNETALEKAVSDMKDPAEIGKVYNKYYHMPFNSRFGLMIWSAVVTAIVYFLYPVLCKISDGTIKTVSGGFVVLGILLLIGVVYYLILRRGHFQFSFLDVRDVSIGFLIGAILSVSILFLTFSFNKYGFYPYFSDIKILFFNSIKIYGSELRTFGEEFMIWFFCVIIYMLSIRTKNKDKSFSFVKNYDGSGIYYVNVDNKFYE